LNFVVSQLYARPVPLVHVNNYNRMPFSPGTLSFLKSVYWGTHSRFVSNN